MRPAQATALALLLVDHRPERTPGTGMVLGRAAGITDDRALVEFQFRHHHHHNQSLLVPEANYHH